ncbi:MAG: hypothetical protein DI587_07710 [Variovorax paradoxus]|nr:MAG: hypothetical protein DI583_07710 [Variovorax paradoxus]PZQ13408.1 MAG: hypothetical protein DI587_07710 [Variovorax paradoxus]
MFRQGRIGLVSSAGRHVERDGGAELAQVRRRGLGQRSRHHGVGVPVQDMDRGVRSAVLQSPRWQTAAGLAVAAVVGASHAGGATG